MARSGENVGSGQGVGLPVGSRIGKYEVREKRGVGGQAIVYKGYDRSLDRFVAIKQISPHLAEDPKFVERFRREAQILARLGAEQLAIVSIHELIEEERGLFIVMEYVPGPTLETILEDTAGPIEPKAALQIIWRLAAALHAVHTMGIIHRDLKPSNIIVSEGLRPKIADFGVAATRSGQTSMLLGTTKYMAPELFGGGDADGRADMYSLGMVAYEMLLGRPKFREVFAEIVRDPHSESLRWMKWHSNEEVKAAPLQELNGAIPPALSDIVAKMMAKKRDDRFENMESLGRAVRTTFSPRGKAASGAARGPSRARRKGERVAAAGAAGAAGAGGLEAELDSAATATIPKKKLSTQEKIAMAAGAFGVLLAGGIVLFLMHKSEQKKIENAAQATYDLAETWFQDGNYALALHAFESNIPRDFPGTKEAYKAWVMAPLTRSRIAELTAVKAEEWDKVTSESLAAREQAKKAQSARRDLDDWARRTIKDIDDREENLLRLRSYRAKMADAEEKFQQKDYVKALAVFDQGFPGDLTKAQTEQRDALRDEIAREKFDAEYGAEIAKGDETAKLDDFDKVTDCDAARAAYDRGNSLLQSTTVLSEEERKALAGKLSLKTGELKRKQNYLQALKDLTAADTPDAKRKALEKLQEIRPTPERKKEIDDARADRMAKDAADALAKGELARARDLARNALRANKDHRGALAVIAKLDQGEERKKLMAQGEAAFSKGDYAEAQKLFESAAAIQPAPALDARLVDCRYLSKLTEADRLRDAGQFDPALTVYEQARLADPTRGTTIDARQSAVKAMKEYSQLFAQGEDALTGGQYSRAREFFTKAKAKMVTPEVRQKIAFASYHENLLLGQSAMERRKPGEALAYFKMARSSVDEAKIDPAEINELIRKAEEDLKANPPS